MKKFSDNLAALTPVEHILQIELFHTDGRPAGSIENKPGSAGSVRVYHHLWQKYGSISLDAAKEGLDLYAEHTEDAAENPGKHPNIDRLFAVIANNQPLTLKAVSQPLH